MKFLATKDWGSRRGTFSRYSPGIPSTYIVWQGHRMHHHTGRLLCIRVRVRALLQVTNFFHLEGNFINNLRAEPQKVLHQQAKGKKILKEIFVTTKTGEIDQNSVQGLNEENAVFYRCSD
ncbi:uncharacterized protein LOC143181136 [Calliopsis andreniformis]|uniref:uncharacterized protein LOC143181136 n=1 Tax=Calliopsis andreniformis TaxID=337506 RepID=UPI003FCD85E8